MLPFLNRLSNHYLHLTGVPLRSTPAGEKYVSVIRYMKKLLIKTGLLYTISYISMYLITLGIILSLGSKMSGLFRWFVLAAAVIPSGYYISIRNHHPLSFTEKSYLIAYCPIITLIVDNSISIYFGINKPPITMGPFYLLALFYAFNRILGKGAR